MVGDGRATIALVADTTTVEENERTRRSLLRGGWLAALGVSAAWSLGACTAVAGVRLDGDVGVPLPPPPSPAEVARARVAGGAQALVDALTGFDPGQAPGDVSARLAGWIEVHLSHLVALAEPVAAPAPGLPESVATGAPPAALAVTAPLSGVAGLLRSMTAQASVLAPTAPAAGALFAQIAIARGAQDLLVRSAAGLAVTVPAWPADSPVEAVQALLSAEHAAVDGYVTATAFARTRRADLQARRRAHQSTRDALVGVLTAVGVSPVPAAPGYGLPPAVVAGGAAAGDPDGRAVALALDLETGVLRTVLGVVTGLLAAEPTTRAAGWPLARASLALAWESEAARQRWGAPPQALPGS